MPSNTKLEVFTCCLPRDLPIARLAVDGILKYLNAEKITLAAPSSAFAQTRNVLGSDVTLIDERDLAGGMTLEALRKKTNIAGFPNRAGWYFQQLIKLGYALHGDATGRYLIWDADTVPLRPIDFFTPEGLPLYTLADEHHTPYFDTYERLLGHRPTPIGSFISQHMIVDKTIAREMLHEIATRHPSAPTWSWAIINNLAPIDSISLFSEYETYGNYVNTRYPNSIAFRRLPWLRNGALYAHTTNPTQQQLAELAQHYDFAAFEDWQLHPPQQTLASRLRRKLRTLSHRSK